LRWGFSAIFFDKFLEVILEKPYLVEAPLSIQIEEVSEERLEEFKREFQSLSEIDSDAIGHWMKMQKARGETAETDEAVLNLLVELYRKIDKLEKIITEGEKRLLPLLTETTIGEIGFNHFKLKDDVFVVGNSYYGRINMITYPQRELPIFFKAIDNQLAEITQIHSRDENDWATYFRARERIMIRERKK
jgi:hypothetical protein